MPFLPTLKSHWLAFLLFAFTGFMGLYDIDRRPLDYDEWAAVNTVTGFGYIRNAPWDGFLDFPAPPAPIFTPADYWQRNTINRVLRYTIDDCGHSIPYYILLHYWIGLFGFSVFRIRVLSALLILLAGVVFYAGALSIFRNRIAAVIALSLFVLHTLVMQYAHIARMYSLALVFTVSAMLFFWSLLDAYSKGNKKKAVQNAVICSILAALMVLCHYFNVMVVAGFAVFLVLFFKKNPGNFTLGLLLSICLPFLLLMGIYFFPLGAWRSLVSIVGMNKTVARTDGNYIGFVRATPMGFVWAVLCRITSAFGNVCDSEFGIKSIINVCLLAFPIALIVLYVKRVRQLYGPALVQLPVIVTCLYFLASLVSYLLFKTTILLHARYWMFMVPFALLLLAGCISVAVTEERGRSRRLSLLLLLVISLRLIYTPFMYLFDGRYAIGHTAGGGVTIKKDRHWTGDPLEQQIKDIKTNYTQKDTIIYNSKYIAQKSNWYLQDFTAIEMIDTTGRMPIDLRKYKH